MFLLADGYVAKKPVASSIGRLSSKVQHKKETTEPSVHETAPKDALVKEE